MFMTGIFALFADLERDFIRERIQGVSRNGLRSWSGSRIRMVSLPTQGIRRV
jgi:hypothetical protein